MALKLTTPASLLPLTLAEAKAHLKEEVADTDNDALITAMLGAATLAAEGRMVHRVLMPQTWTLTLDSFPEAFELTRVPVASVASLQYVDTAGVTQTLNTSLYSLDNASDFGSAYVVPAYGTAWPATREQINAVTLRYVAGYASAAAVPEPIKAWIKLQLGAMYESRQSESAVKTHALGFADSLLDPYMVGAV